MQKPSFVNGEAAVEFFASLTVRLDKLSLKLNPGMAGNFPKPAPSGSFDLEEKIPVFNLNRSDELFFSTLKYFLCLAFSDE